MATRTLKVVITGETRGLTRALDEGERKSSKFGGAFAKLGGVVGGALAGGAVLAGLRSVTNAGTDLNETMNKVGLAFGKNQGAIQAWAQGSAKSMGLPKQAALDGASSFGLLFSKLGVGAGDTAKMSKSMVQLAVDLGSVHNADPTEIIEAQTAAFRGEYDGLQKFVPAISAATVQTEALRQTGKNNAKQLTDSEKAQAVYSIMLKQTTTEQGDFARTSDDAANKTKINAARMADLSANLGTILLPAVTAVTNALGSRADWMENNRTAATVLGGAVALVTGLLVANTVATKAKVAWDTAWMVGTKLVTAAQWALNVALRANPIGLVITAVALLAAGLIYAYKHSETFRKIVDGAFDAIVASAKAMWSAIKPVFTVLVSTWLAVAGSIVNGAATAFGWVPGIGGKLKTAAAKFGDFRDSVNRSLNGIDDEKVNVTARAGVTWTAEATKFRMKAGRMATGGLVRGPGGIDQVPIWATAGEAVVPTHLVPEVAPWLAAKGVPGFAAGGLVPHVGFSNQISAGPFQQMATGLAKGVAAAVGRGLTKAMAASFGGLGGGTGPGGWQWQMAVLRSQFPGMQLISGFRPGAVTHATGRQSYHALGRAVDIPPVMGYFNWIAAHYGRNTKELIFSPAGGNQIHNGSPHMYSGVTRADHWNHVHWAYDRGGWLPPGLSMAYNGTGRPERVLPPGGGGEVHIHFHGPVLGDARKVARELEPAIRSAMRSSLGREGKPLAKQL